MVEDLLDNPWVFDTGDDLHPPTTVPASLYVDPEDALQTLRPRQGGTALRCCLDRAFTAVPGTVWGHLGVQTAVGREHPVEAREVDPRFRNKRCQGTSFISGKKSWRVKAKCPPREEAVREKRTKAS
jgi:hypothetical protein